MTSKFFPDKFTVSRRFTRRSVLDWARTGQFEKMFCRYLVG